MRSLYARLTVALLGLLALLGALTLLLTLLTSRYYEREVQQRLNRDLAAHIVKDRRLLNQGEVRHEELTSIFDSLMLINPAIEVYLVAPDGKILAYSAPPGKVKRDRIATEPIRALLDGEQSLPVLGDDPRDPERRKIFSAAPIEEDGRLTGWLYIVLAGEHQASIAQMVQRSYVLRLSIGIAVGILLLALLGGTVLFRRLTRRLRLLTRRIESAESRLAGEATALDGPARGDEITALSHTFSQMAERIEAQIQELRKQDELRRSLVANVSHDLRTPLTHLQGYLETLQLKEGRLDEGERRECLEIAVKQSVSLGRRIAALFELSKLDARQEPLVTEAFSPAELAQDVVQKFRLQAEARGITLAADVATEVGPIEGDIGLIERVLENLIENAMQHTPTGGHVTVSVHANPPWVRIAVADDGSGIPAADLPHVFERFYRARGAAGHGHEGSGLGLAIAWRALELHGSRLAVESVPGHGATFHFRLPLAQFPARRGRASSTPETDQAGSQPAVRQS